MTGKVKILIVEDEMPLALLMVHLLAQADCETEVATTRKKAMQLAEEEKFDLITLDVDLRDGSGFEIYSELKQRHLSRHTPIIFISGRPHEEDMRRGLELGAVDYITKPFETFEFASRLLSHIKTHARLCVT